MKIDNMPKIKLINLPTPIDELARLRKVIGGPKILMKRDDLTGLAYGGNKSRKLEYLLGQAKKEGADTIITSGALQTNHGRLTAAACAKEGLDFYLVITEEEREHFEGNTILQSWLGTNFVFIDPVQPREGEDIAKARLRAGDDKISQLCHHLTAKGKKPYIIPRGGRSLQGTASYCAAIREIKQQLAGMEETVNYIIVPVATGSTMTGILLGTKAYDLPAKVIGMSVSRPCEEVKSMIIEEFNKDAKELGYSYQIENQDFIIDNSYIGQGYGISTEAGLQAIKLLAETEAIFLDPVYTGKAMAGYLDLVSKGFFSDKDNVLFIHTGGGPLMFLDSIGQKAKEMRKVYEI